MHKEITIQNNYTIHRCDERLLALILLEIGAAGTMREIHEKDGSIKKKHHSSVIQALKDYKGKYKDHIKVRQGHNLVPLTLREAFAELLVGDTVTPTFEGNYMALGSDDTTPANTDTQLGTETIRGTFSNKYAVDNVAYFDKFFSSSEVGGNSYLEAGIFVDGTGSANSGYLLSRILIDETLATNETLSFNCSITIA